MRMVFIFPFEGFYQDLPRSYLPMQKVLKI